MTAIELAAASGGWGQHPVKSFLRFFATGADRPLSQ
jgi:hypothetical protein